MESSSVRSRLAAVSSALPVWGRIFRSPWATANDVNPIRRLTSFLPSSLRIRTWGRNINLLSISFPCPKAWLSLGHASPSDDCHRGGNLRLSADTTFTCLAVTHSNILTSHRSSRRHRPPSLQWKRSSTTPHSEECDIRDFGTMLSPGTFSAHRASPEGFE